MTSAIRLSGTNLERAADHNQRITLHAIRVRGTTTRVELAQLTGLTAPTVANITKRLLADNLIQEDGQIRSGRGQPATKLIINRNACYSIGVNIDRDHIAIVIVNFVGEIVARRTVEIDFALPNDVRDFYTQSVRELVDEAGIAVDTLVGIGVATPDDLGSIELSGRPADFGLWDETNMADLFTAPFPLPVFVENDAAAAAMGEQQLGSGSLYGSAFYILISWGLGGGFFLDGQYVRGADGRSGELGFLNYRNRDGSSEQVQQLVSLSGLAKHLKKSGLNLATLFDDDQNKAFDMCVDAWMDEAALRLSDALISVNCLINPAVILIGGRLPSKYLVQFTQKVGNHMVKSASHIPVVAPVKQANLAADAPSIGAAILPFSHYLLPTSSALWKSPSGDDTNSWMQRG